LEFENVNLKLKNYNMSLLDYQQRTKIINDNLQTCDLSVDYQKNILEEFDKIISDETSIELRTDLSIQKIGTFTKVEHYSHIEFNFNTKIYKETIILITRLEHDDETLRKYLNIDDLIPGNLDIINKLTNEIVLYNNRNYYGNIHVKSEYSPQEKRMIIDVRCDIPFKILFYYTKNLKKIQVYIKD